MTPEQRRKIGYMMAARKRELKFIHRHFPQWYAGMSVKEYVRAYRMANIGAVDVCFHPDEIHFLKGEQYEHPRNQTVTA